MLLEILTVVFLFSAMTVWGFVFATLVSVRVAKFIGFTNWGDFACALALGVLPLFNTILAISLVTEMMPKLPTPKTWK